MRNRKTTIRTILFAIALLLLLAIFVYPIIIVFINSIKPVGEILGAPLSLPKTVQLSNFIQAWKITSMGKLLRNSAILTICSVSAVVVFSAMSAYWCHRHRNAVTRTFTALLMVSMLIPFASLMIPLVKITSVLHINNTLLGAIIVFVGVGLAFGFFMMQSAVKTLPRELEEAAALDGCGPVRTFFSIVFPLMKNTVFSLIAMDLFWVWNDFMIPQTLLNSTKYDTVQVGINKLFGMYASKWDIALAALVMSMIPTIIAFLLLQKQILGGVSDGATKG